MQHSVIRRSILVGAVFVFGYLFHYGLMLAANRILDPATFGRFYTAISLLNVLLTPATVLSFMFAQHFSTVFAAGGAAAVTGELRLLLRQNLAAGGIGGLAGAVLLLVGASLFGANAFMLLVLVPGVALAVYLFELSRAALQGMLNFMLYSVMWIAWRATQFVLALLALLAIGTAWSGMAGILIATILTTVALLWLIFRREPKSTIRAHAEQWPPFRIAPAVPFALEYGCFVLAVNLDVLVAYLILPNDALGTYSASSLLPKALVTAAQPVSQVMLPVMSVAAKEQNVQRIALLKAIIACAMLGVAGAMVLGLGGDLVCNDRYGIRFCHPELLTVLAIAAIPLTVLRVLVVAGLALGGRRHVVLCAALLIAFVGVMVWRTAGPNDLAIMYLMFCWLFTVAYAIAMYGGRQRATTG